MASNRRKNKKRFKPLKFLLIIILIIFSIFIIPKTYIAISTAPEINYSELRNLKTKNYKDLNSIPDDLENAFIAIEDHRFKNHPGVDPIAILGSIRDNLRSSALVRGGSTITQQLVKNTYLTPEKTLNRKILEAYLSIRIERNLEKNTILEKYLNTINLGQNSFGVEQASIRYFNKNVDELNLAECALIASITKSPSYYSPIILRSDQIDGEFIDKVKIDGKTYFISLNKNSLNRQKIVLKKMLDYKYINKNDYNEAINYKIENSINPNFKKFN
ncbi:MAG: transglycosylase domain-containing protein [Peptoniphilaceae bacterium]